MKSVLRHYDASIRSQRLLLYSRNKLAAVEAASMAKGTLPGESYNMCSKVLFVIGSSPIAVCALEGEDYFE